MSRVTVAWPGGRAEVSAPAGTGLLEVLRLAGAPVAAPCGGRGSCGKCRVTWVTETGQQEVLACQTRLLGDGTLSLHGAALVGGLEERTAGQTAYGGRCAGAVDLGTTTVAVRLISLPDGRTLGESCAWNRQAAYGGDVISRAQYTMEQPNGLAELRDTARGQVVELLRGLCAAAGAELGQVERVTVAGNPIMEHLLAGLDPASIARAPYTPSTRFDHGRAIQLPELPGAEVYLLPCVSGYVGGDITAGLLASGLYEKPGLSLFLDVGTNGEMALGGKDGFLCCSVASGPAFEGAEISCGMASAPGAVRHVAWENGGFRLDVVGDTQPRGLCGSGLIDLLAALLRCGAVDETGRLLPPEEAPEEFQFLEEDEDGNGVCYVTKDRSVYLTAGDVRKLQLAKAAVRAGIGRLLDEAGAAPEQVDLLYIAGGFGGGLDPGCAAAIGMIPAQLKDKVVTLGNSALEGAARLADAPECWQDLLGIQKNCRYLELSGDSQFSTAFVENMLFFS